MTSTSQQLALDQARAWWDEAPVYLDTETTGLTGADTVIEIALIDADGRPLLDSLVHTTRPISSRAEKVHGINHEMLETAPRWKKVAGQLQTLLEGQAVGLYNASFDLKMIRQTNRQHGVNWDPTSGLRTFDLMDIYARYRGIKRPGRPGFRWFSLEDAARQAGLRLTNSHRAKDDALLTRDLHRYLVTV